MKVLVTGGAGFIGSHVTQQLISSGHKVIVLDNLIKGQKTSVDPKAKLVVGDIADAKSAQQALQGVDAVIHMAGLIVVPESVHDPILYSKNNFMGTIKFLESMRKTGVKKIIFSSSATVYGSPQKLPITEDTPLHPDNPYGASKAAVESYLQTYNAVFGFDSIILRYFNPYGPGENHVPETHAIPNFIKSTLKRTSIPLYWGGEQIRDFIYIDDLVQAHIDVLNLTGHQIFNIGTEKGVKVMDVIEEIFKIVGYKVPIKNLGNRPGDVAANYASSRKLRETVGWTAKVNLTDGLKKTIEYYKTHG